MASQSVPPAHLDSPDLRARLQTAYDNGFRHGRTTRIWGFAWRVTMLVLMLVGALTLLSNFGIYLSLIGGL